jgi:hypothetical protein
VADSLSRKNRDFETPLTALPGVSFQFVSSFSLSLVSLFNNASFSRHGWKVELEKEPGIIKVPVLSF